MNEITIHITQKIIDEFKEWQAEHRFGVCENCPVARALIEAGYLKASVGLESFQLGDGRRFRLPSSVLPLVDEPETIVPQSITLDLAVSL